MSESAKTGNATKIKQFEEPKLSWFIHNQLSKKKKCDCFTWDCSQTQPERTRFANISQMQKLSWLFVSKWTNKRFQYEQCPDAPEACSVCQFHWPNTHSTPFRFQWQHIARSTVLSAKDFTNVKLDEQIANETPPAILMDRKIRIIEHCQFWSFPDPYISPREFPYNYGKTWTTLSLTKS